MRIGNFVAAGLLLIMLLPAAIAQQQNTQSEKAETGKRAITVPDVIEMTQIGDRSYLDDFTRKGNVVRFSPDGSRFAFVTQKGNLANDTVEFSLFVFDTATAIERPHAERIITIASSSNREAISHLKWLPDNDTIVFLGEQPGEKPQLYSVNCSSRKLEKLTSSATPIVSFSLSDSGKEFVYITEVPPEPVVTPEMQQHGFAVTSARWEDLYTNQPAIYDTRREIYFKNLRMRAPQRVSGVFDFADPEITDLVKVSPDGHYAVIRTFRVGAPHQWDGYEISFKSGSFKSCSPGDAFGCPSQYFLLDLTTGALTPLLNAPLAQNDEATGLFDWTADGSVLMINVLLSLDGVSADEAARRARTVYIAEMVPSTGKIIKIAESSKPWPLFSLNCSLTRSEFVAVPQTEFFGHPYEFRKRSSTWTMKEISPGAAHPTGPLNIMLRQDINMPPQLVAEERATGRTGVLLDLNPQLRQLALGRVELIHWETPAGGKSEGMLYYPPDYIQGKRYPLVVQTHGTTRDRFWMDGPFSTGFAAQPLAAKGFLVLQIALGDPTDKSNQQEILKVFDTQKEAPYFAQFFDSAIEELDRRALIDTQRIGVTGFSRTAYHVLYALTHSRHSIAAATVADGVNFGYVDCVYYLVRWNASLCENMNGGGPPYGKGLQGWAADAPTFNLDKIHAPILLQAISGPLAEWEILQGLRWLKKPVEMINFYPEGAHILVRPRQRLLSQESVVDWYYFWLQGKEDPNPAKAEQYKWWHELRKLQQENTAHQN
jgi:dipeptidyl aminopeptidase/acylaminoacyl peptidase